jgi:hypothetical protein
MLIQLLIEKLVAFIVPAAGALKLIIDGLRAAWGAASRILQAFQRFMAFLRLVARGGAEAAGAFANMLAAAAVAVLDFLANFLISKLRGAGSQVGGRLQALAQAIQRRLGGVARAVMGGVRAARRGLTTAARTVARVARSAVRAVGRGAVRLAQAVARSPIGRMVARAGRAFMRTRLGKALSRYVGSARTWFRRQVQRLRDVRERRRRRRAERSGDRLNRAISALRPSIGAMLGRGVSGFRLLLSLGVWRIKYRLRTLRYVRRDAQAITFEAGASPNTPFMEGRMPRGEALREMVRRAVGELLTSEEVRKAARDQLQQFPAGTKAAPVQITPGAGLPGMSIAQRWLRRQGTLARVARFAMGRFMTLRRPGSTQPDPRFAVWMRQPNILRPNVLMNIPSLGLGRLPGIPGRARYPGIAKEISRIPGGEQALARDFSSFIQTGNLPDRLEPHRGYLTGVGLLMFGTESTRSPMNVAMAPMTLQLIERNKLSFQDAFAAHEKGSLARPQGGGRFPASMKGTEEAAAELERERRGGGPRSVDAQELAQREIWIAEKWLESEMIAQGLEAFTDDDHAYRFIRDRLLSFYNVAIRHPARL